ncbi:MAG: TonB-dependent receptor plug domain-containing protein, partial [Candidatus Cloacimonetes bacterium]|nr:TonB-dependent receptor plug domain-containing protein [Candidatus Cloacimonadota bacterium]
MKIFNLLILLFIFTNSLIASEIDTLKTILRHYNLEGIRVIADRPQETIGTVEIIELDPVSSLPEINIAESIEKVNGLHVSTGGKSGSTLRIRGFDNDQIKIMLDGRPLGGGYFGNVDLNTIPVSDIKEIRILKGPVSSLYGSDTMGGVINIITDSPSNTSWLKMGTEFKRNNTNKSYLSSTRDLGEWDYWLYASHYHTDGFMLSKDFVPTNTENGEVRDNCEKDQWDLQSKLNFTIFDFHSIGFQAGYTFMDTKEIPGSIYENQLRKFIDWKRYQFSTLGSFQLRYNLTSDVNIYYDRYDDTYAEYNPYTGEMYPQWPSNLKSCILGAHQKFDWEITDYLNSAFGYRFEKQSYLRKDNKNYPDWFGNEQLKHNGFWQVEFSYNSLNLTVGSGVSFFKQNGRDSWISHFEPSAGIYYKNSHNWKSSLAFSSNTKYPTMHQLFSSSSGNDMLEEERARKSEFNLLIPYSFDSFSGSIQQTIFYNHITGLIDKLGGTYANI